MLRLVLLSILQSLCLSSGQVCLKLAMVRMEAFSWTKEYFFSLLTNWWFLLVGITMGSATILWLHIVKNYPLSIAYPLTSLSFIFGVVGALLFFHEAIPFTRWLGVIFIVIGACFIVK